MINFRYYDIRAAAWSVSVERCHLPAGPQGVKCTCTLGQFVPGEMSKATS